MNWPSSEEPLSFARLSDEVLRGNVWRRERTESNTQNLKEIINVVENFRHRQLDTPD